MALVGVAATDKQVPFKGTLQGQETDAFQGDLILLVSGEASGIATHLGRFTMVYKDTVSAPVGSATGSVQLTASNGDMIFATNVGQGTPVPDMPGINQIVEINTITGGTGRFAGARGTFTVERLVDLTDLARVPTSGSFSGMLTLPGAAR